MDVKRSDTQTTLSVESVTYKYGSRVALSEVTFDIVPGQFVALLGLNGAGKTTLFSLITRLFGLQQGSIWIAGADVRRGGSRVLAPIGVVFQQPALDLDLTVRQNLRYFASLHGLSRSAADDRMSQALDDLGIVERVDEKVRVLSGGYRRRVEIARALVHEPRLLLLDEATAGLDVPSRAAIVEHVHRLASERKISVLWATHLIDEIWPVDDLVVLHSGQVVGKGSVGHIVEQTGAEDLLSAFQRLVAEKDVTS